MENDVSKGQPVLAVYGGSFDPPHLGHILVCAYVLSTHEVSGIVVLPVADHPFSKRLTSFDHRFAMCELAFADLKRVTLSRLESELPTPSLTVRTLEKLSTMHPGVCLRLVIGSDLLPQLPSWHEAERVRTLAPPLIVPRAGYPDPAAPGPALPDVSSSELRDRLAHGGDTRGMLHPRAAAYARKHALYRTRAR